MTTSLTVPGGAPIRLPQPCITACDPISGCAAGDGDDEAWLSGCYGDGDDWTRGAVWRAGQ